jgi:hypothetical protein
VSHLFHMNRNFMVQPINPSLGEEPGQGEPAPRVLVPSPRWVRPHRQWPYQTQAMLDLNSETLIYSDSEAWDIYNIYKYMKFGNLPWHQGRCWFMQHYPSDPTFSKWGAKQKSGLMQTLNSKPHLFGCLFLNQNHWVFLGTTFQNGVGLVWVISTTLIFNCWRLIDNLVFCMF